MGANIFRDPVAAVRDIVGGQAGACEKVPEDARDAAIGEMTDEAASRGANAAVGVDFDHEVPGDRGSMLMVSANGTAVVVEQGRRLLPRWPQNGTSHRAFRKEPRRVPRIKAEECGPRNGEGSKQGSDIPFTAALLLISAPLSPASTCRETFVLSRSPIGSTNSERGKQRK